MENMLLEWHKNYDKKPSELSRLLRVTEQKLQQVLCTTGFINIDEWKSRENWAGHHHDKGSINDNARCRRCGILIFTNDESMPRSCNKTHNENMLGACPKCADCVEHYASWEDLMKQAGWSKGIAQGTWLNGNRVFIEYQKRNNNLTEGEYRRKTFTTP